MNYLLMDKETQFHSAAPNGFLVTKSWLYFYSDKADPNIIYYTVG